MVIHLVDSDFCACHLLQTVIKQMETFYLWTKKSISQSFWSKLIENETIFCTCGCFLPLELLTHKIVIWKNLLLHELQAEKQCYLRQKFWLQNQLKFAVD